MNAMNQKTEICQSCGMPMGTGARRIIVAAPVSDLATKKALQVEANEVIIPETPADFYAVSQAYESFHDLSDKETIAFLERWDKEQKKMEM